MISRKLAMLMMASALISPGSVFAQTRGRGRGSVDFEKSYDSRLNSDVARSMTRNIKIGLTVGAAAAIVFPTEVGVGGALVIAVGFTLIGGMLPTTFRTASNEAFGSFDSAFDVLMER